MVFCIELEFFSNQQPKTEVNVQERHRPVLRLFQLKKAFFKSYNCYQLRDDLTHNDKDLHKYYTYIPPITPKEAAVPLADGGTVSVTNNVVTCGAAGLLDRKPGLLGRLGERLTFC